MMRTMRVIGLALGMAVAMAQGAVITTEAGGAFQLKLWVHADGTALILSNNPAEWVAIDGYEIHSAGGRLILGQYPTYAPGWAPGSLAANSGVIAEVLYADGTFVRDAGSGASKVAESNATGAAYFDPVGTGWHFSSPAKPLGERILQAGTPLSDLKAYYSMPGYPGDKFEMAIVPEPASLCVLLVGGLAGLARRRR